MNNITAAAVLMGHLSEITDGAYKTAIEIAIEAIFKDAKKDYLALQKHSVSQSDSQLNNIMTFRDYLGLSSEDYAYWILKEKSK